MKLTSPECPLDTKVALKLLGEEEVEYTPQPRERQGQSKCQGQFLPLKPEGRDAILHNLGVERKKVCVNRCSRKCYASSQSIFFGPDGFGGKDSLILIVHPT